MCGGSRISAIRAVEVSALCWCTGRPGEGVHFETKEGAGSVVYGWDKSEIKLTYSQMSALQMKQAVKNVCCQLVSRSNMINTFLSTVLQSVMNISITTFYHEKSAHDL